MKIIRSTINGKPIDLEQNFTIGVDNIIIEAYVKVIGEKGDGGWIFEDIRTWLRSELIFAVCLQDDDKSLNLLFQLPCICTGINLCNTDTDLRLVRIELIQSEVYYDRKKFREELQKEMDEAKMQ